MTDTTLATFERDVLEASRALPVLVDFWAPWCGPCRALGPLLEKLEQEAAGQWKLVKVNSDENPELSQQFGVRSIPFVVAFVDGRPASQFMGAQPEGMLRAFLAKLVPSPAGRELRLAREALAAGKAAEAEDHLRNAIAIDPSGDEARIELVDRLLDRGEAAQAKAQWALLTGKAGLAPHHDRVAARLEAAHQAASLPPAEELERRIALNPDDLAARLDLAQARIAAGNHAGAMDELLEIVRRDRAFGDDIGRKKMLVVLELAAQEPDLVSDYRRRLSSALF